MFSRSRPHNLPRRPYSQSLPPGTPTLGLPTLRPSHTFPGLPAPGPSSQPLPQLTGFPLGPSSPVGPLGPGGPASPGCPDSPFSPRSPRGPWRMRGRYRWSQGDLQGQGCSPRFQDPFSLPQALVMEGCAQKGKPTVVPGPALPGKGAGLPKTQGQGPTEKAGAWTAGQRSRSWEK